jgi:hypothetical protein
MRQKAKLLHLQTFAGLRLRRRDLSKRVYCASEWPRPTFARGLPHGANHVQHRCRMHQPRHRTQRRPLHRRYRAHQGLRSNQHLWMVLQTARCSRRLLQGTEAMHDVRRTPARRDLSRVHLRTPHHRVSARSLRVCTVHVCQFARRRGFEPLTFGFGDQRSIQLS